MTRDADNLGNQLKLETKTCSRRKARENLCELLTIDFGFTSDWLNEEVAGGFSHQSVSVVMENECKCEIL